ncbi:SET and MYND domain-containing protein 1-like [Tropilaelaps mercedesae]|uniref:SET and MYND domain-containing protein 1-like n=1 Tax=Tropilaelaps mercedesae TaxID=418985 RepID=A0A1V9XEA5_9ACAR|nr:SET and MYND domain-containing protein 1-like [Tropilaelaps mercedesae]
MEPILYYMCSGMAKLGWNKKDSKEYDAFDRGYRLAKKLYTVSHGKKHAILRMLRSFKQFSPELELVPSEG